MKVLKPIFTTQVSGKLNPQIFDLLPRDYLIELYNQHRGEEPEMTDKNLAIESSDDEL